LGAVIKSGEFVYVAGLSPSSMQTPLVSPTKTRAESDAEKNSEQDAPEISEARREEAKRLSEYERIKRRYIDEGEKSLAEAREKAKVLIGIAEDEGRVLLENAKKEQADIRKKAEEAGYEAGYKAGEKAGFDEGYGKGLRKCKDTLVELNSVIERLPAEKERIFKNYENRLFDLIFAVSNKITVGSLKQKDKAVISKMLKEAAKGFRGSSYIKISLSKLDIEDSVSVDLDDLARIFGANQHIEFEILKDAPKGTLILDNGSEITDAGITTQLKMIENLGKGKFKNKPDNEDDEEGDYAEYDETEE
jgi:flagellar biosynthesis/type III secretory pathway protein FliH